MVDHPHPPPAATPPAGPGAAGAAPPPAGPPAHPAAGAVAGPAAGAAGVGAPAGGAAPGSVPAGAAAVPPEDTAPPHRGGARRVLLLAAVVGGIAVCAVGLLAWLGWRIGPAALAVGVAAAVLPVPVLVAAFLWLDRFEPEPVRYLAFCFCWGAFVATAASLTVNQTAAWWFARVDLPESVVAVVVAPFIEELTKALGPLLLLWRRRGAISGMTDGIVYCGLAATGFAMVENILYLGGHGYASAADKFGPASGAQMVLLMWIARILFTGFAHPLFTALTGVGVGIAARSPHRWARLLAPLAGLLLAMLLHGAWNLMATLAAGSGEPAFMLYGYVAVMMPIFFGMVGLALYLRSWEGRLTERTLPHYVRAGWLSPPEVAALGTLPRRHAARVWARRVAGEPGLRAMRAFQFAAVRLALLRDGAERGLDRTPAQAAATGREEAELLATMVAHRQVFTGRDPAAPPARWDGARYVVDFPDGSRRALPAPREPVVPLPMLPPPPPPGWWPTAGPAAAGGGPPVAAAPWLPAGVPPHPGADPRAAGGR